MTALTFQGLVISGKVKWRDPHGIAQYIAGLEGKRVLITVEEYSGKRSLQQNAYSWVIYELMAERTGYQAFEVKEEMQKLFLSRPDRRGRMRIRGTSKLNKRQFGEYLEQVIWFAATWLEVAIPPPEACQESYAALA